MPARAARCRRWSPYRRADNRGRAGFASGAGEKAAQDRRGRLDRACSLFHGRMGEIVSGKRVIFVGTEASRFDRIGTVLHESGFDVVDQMASAAEAALSTR